MKMPESTLSRDGSNVTMISAIAAAVLGLGILASLELTIGVEQADIAGYVPETRGERADASDFIMQRSIVQVWPRSRINNAVDKELTSLEALYDFYSAMDESECTEEVTRYLYGRPASRAFSDPNFNVALCLYDITMFADWKTMFADWKRRL